jgi:hypothetical protein
MLEAVDTEIGPPTVPDQDVARQAVSALRGYVYQMYASALAWTKLGPDEILLLEVAEDFATVSSSALKLTQTGDTRGSGAITLRHPKVVAAINSFWRFQSANPGRAVRLEFLTTSPVGLESGSAFRHGRAGLEHWRDAARDEADLTQLRAFLLTLDLAADLALWLRDAGDDEVRECLLRGIRWECGEPPLAGLDELLNDATANLCAPAGIPPSEARTLTNLMVLDLLRAAVQQDPQARSRSRPDLLRLMEESLYVSVPRSSLRRGRSQAVLAPSLPTGLDPIEAFPTAAFAIDRTEVSSRIRLSAAEHGVTWLFGASGTGKTSLAAETVRSTNTGWFIGDLSEAAVPDTARRLRDYTRALARQPRVSGVILDDLPAAAAIAVRNELQLLRALLNTADAALIVTTYREPPPSLAGAMGLDPSTIQRAPHFTLEEVRDLIAKAGGDVTFWTNPVYAFCGQGHPQLVAARITGLRYRGWPKAEVVDGLPASTSPRDVAAEQEATRLRLREQLPDSARQLAFRLSILAGDFDRRLAIDIGAATPPIAEPGLALDLLSGPWIEVRPGGRLRVSPLLANAGNESFSANEKKIVHATICDSLVGRRPFPGEQLTQLLLSAFASDHRPGLMTIAKAATNTGSDADRLAHALFVFPLIRNDDWLFPADVNLSRMLRVGQLKVAAGGQDADRILKIYRRLLVEVADASEPQLQRSAAAFIVISAKASPLRPQQWFEVFRAFEAGPLVEYVNSETATVPEKGVVPDVATAMFALRATSLKGLEELSDLFDVLDGVDATDRHRYLNDLPEPYAGCRAIVQTAWLSASQRPDFNAQDAVLQLTALQRRAEAWGEETLAMELVCASAVMHAEYLDDKAEALKLLEDGRTRWPASIRVRRELAKVYFSLGQFKEVLDQGAGIVAAADPIDRAHVARELGVSAAHIGDFQAAFTYLSTAEETANQTQSLADAAAGLTADKAFVLWRSGERVGALRAMRLAAMAAGRLDQARPRAAYVVRASNLVARGMWQDLDRPGWDRDLPALYGFASRTPTEWEGPKPTLLGVWYLLAAIEDQLGLDLGFEADLLRETAQGRILTYELLEIPRRFLRALRRADPDAIAGQMDQYASVTAYTLTGQAVEDMGIFDEAATLPWDGRFDVGQPAVRKIAMHAILAAATFNLIGIGKDILPALKAAFAARDDTRGLVDHMPSWPAAFDANAALPARVLWSVAVLHADRPDTTDLFWATAWLWGWLSDTIFPRDLFALIGPALAARWLFIATAATFSLRSPAYSAAKIKSAANNLDGMADLARLLVNLTDAVGVIVPPAVLAEWRKSASPELA